MSLLPTETELQARALTDLRLGLPVAVKIGANFALVAAAETMDAARFSHLQARGDLHLALTDWRARTLKASIYHGDVTRIAVPEDVPLAWLRAMAAPSTPVATIKPIVSSVPIRRPISMSSASSPAGSAMNSRSSQTMTAG